MIQRTVWSNGTNDDRTASLDVWAFKPRADGRPNEVARFVCPGTFEVKPDEARDIAAALLAWADRMQAPAPTYGARGEATHCPRKDCRHPWVEHNLANGCTQVSGEAFCPCDWTG